jgi:hypothetical protein
MTYRPRSGVPLDAGRVTWAHAIIGMVAVFGLQAILLAVQAIGAPAEMIATLRDFAVVIVLSLAVPYLVITGIGALFGKAANLPAAFLFLSILLLLMLLFVTAFSQFLGNSGAATLGIVAFIVFYTVRHMLTLSIWTAILGGLIAAALTVAAGFVLIALPTGQAMLAAA